MTALVIAAVVMTVLVTTWQARPLDVPALPGDPTAAELVHG
jgi:hypothetical protein